MNKIDIATSELLKAKLKNANAKAKHAKENDKFKSSLDAKLGDSEKIPKDKKLYETATDFESILMYQMIEIMDKTVQKSGFIDGGAGEKVFKSMLNEEYSKSLANNSKLGLAENIYEQLGGKYMNNQNVINKDINVDKDDKSQKPKIDIKS